MKYLLFTMLHIGWGQTESTPNGHPVAIYGERIAHIPLLDEFGDTIYMYIYRQWMISD